MDDMNGIRQERGVFTEKSVNYLLKVKTIYCVDV